jgi:hypothetical protein
MATLYDFECDTCSRKFEQLVDGNPERVPCASAPVCTGQAVRQLGGRPQVSTSVRADTTCPVHGAQGYRIVGATFFLAPTGPRPAKA